MSPEGKDRRQPFKRIKEKFPRVGKFYHDLTSDRLVAREKNELFALLDARRITPEVREQLMQVASDVYWYHFGERRLTGEPYIMHPYSVAKTIAKNPYIPVDELKTHITLALIHDLEENTDITSEQLEELNKHPFVKKGMLLLTRFRKSDGGVPESRKDNFRRLLEEGDIGHMRVKIADWEHNLQTTPKSVIGYRPKKWDKIKRLQEKFGLTSEFILPLIRTFPAGEREYLYNKIQETYNEYKSWGAPDLEPLDTVA